MASQLPPICCTPILQTFLRYGVLSLVPTQAQENDEAHRLELRRGQRLRAKERKEARKSAQIMTCGLRPGIQVWSCTTLRLREYHGTNLEY